MRLSMLPLLLAALPLAATPLSAEGGAVGHRIILFGASWCAPCLAEYRTLAKLAASAAPDRIAVAWIDGRVPAHIPGVEVAEGDAAKRLMSRFADDAPGLPYAVMIDAKGGRCAQWSGALTEPDIVRLRAACDRPRASVSQSHGA